jgi:hypothetical protein
VGLRQKVQDVFLKIGARIDLGLIEKRCGATGVDFASDLFGNPCVLAAVTHEDKPLRRRPVV